MSTPNDNPMSGVETSPFRLEITARDARAGMGLQELQSAIAQIAAAGFVTVADFEPHIKAVVGWSGQIKKITAEGSKLA